MAALKTRAQLKAALDFLTLENEKLNQGKPADNLHVTGHLLPSCNYCSAIVALSWALGKADPATGKVREFPYITEDEREKLRGQADQLMNSRLLPAEAHVNNF